LHTSPVAASDAGVATLGAYFCLPGIAALSFLAGVQNSRPNS
jgi:hypothetical protein